MSVARGPAGYHNQLSKIAEDSESPYSYRGGGTRDEEKDLQAFDNGPFARD